VLDDIAVLPRLEGEEAEVMASRWLTF